MRLFLDDENVIGYELVGDTDGGIEIDKSICPTGFFTKFMPNLYKYDGKEITINTDYVAPSEPEVQPTAEQQAITALAQQVADLTETNTQLEQAITALATGGDK